MIQTPRRMMFEIEVEDRASLDAEAIAWLVMQCDQSFSQWVGFARWLETDPRHVWAYRRLAAINLAVDALLDRLHAVATGPHGCSPLESVPAKLGHR